MKLSILISALAFATGCGKAIDAIQTAPDEPVGAKQQAVCPSSVDVDPPCYYHLKKISGPRASGGYPACSTSILATGWDPTIPDVGQIGAPTSGGASQFGIGSPNSLGSWFQPTPIFAAPTSGGLPNTSIPSGVPGWDWSWDYDPATCSYRSWWAGCYYGAGPNHVANHDDPSLFPDYQIQLRGVFYDFPTSPIGTLPSATAIVRGFASPTDGTIVCQSEWTVQISETTCGLTFPYPIRPGAGTGHF